MQVRTLTGVAPERLRQGDLLRLEDSKTDASVEGYIQRFENGNLVWLHGHDKPFDIVETKRWSLWLAGRPEPEPFQVIRFPDEIRRPAFVRREDGRWARIPGPADPASVDISQEQKLSIEDIAKAHGWDWTVASVEPPK